MATHSSVLSWRIPWTEEPGGLQSMGSPRVDHDLATKPHLLDPAIIKTEHSKNKDHGIWSHHFMANRWGNSVNSDRLYFGGLQKSLHMVTAAMKLKDAYSLEEKL